MSVWLELHCDRRLRGILVKDSETMAHYENCRSDENENPSRMAYSFSREQMAVAQKYIELEARRKGWQRVRTAEGYCWHCSFCKDGGIREKHANEQTPQEPG